MVDLPLLTLRTISATIFTATDPAHGSNRRPPLRLVGAPALSYRADPQHALPLWGSNLNGAGHVRHLLAWWRITVPVADHLGLDHLVPADAFVDFTNNHRMIDPDMLVFPCRLARHGVGTSVPTARPVHRLVLGAPDDGITDTTTLWQCMQYSDPAVLHHLSSNAAWAAAWRQPVYSLAMPQAVSYLRASVGLSPEDDNLDLAPVFLGHHQEPAQIGAGSTIASAHGAPPMPAIAGPLTPAFLHDTVTRLLALSPTDMRRLVDDAGLTPQQTAALAEASMRATVTHLRRAGDEAGARRAARTADRCAGVLTPGTFGRG